MSLSKQSQFPIRGKLLVWSRCLFRSDTKSSQLSSSGSADKWWKLIFIEGAQLRGVVVFQGFLCIDPEKSVCFCVFIAEPVDQHLVILVSLVKISTNVLSHFFAKLSQKVQNWLHWFSLMFVYHHQNRQMLNQCFFEFFCGSRLAQTN